MDKLQRYNNTLGEWENVFNPSPDEIVVFNCLTVYLDNFVLNELIVDDLKHKCRIRYRVYFDTGGSAGDRAKLPAPTPSGLSASA